MRRPGMGRGMEGGVVGMEEVVGMEVVGGMVGVVVAVGGDEEEGREGLGRGTEDDHEYELEAQGYVLRVWQGLAA